MRAIILAAGTGSRMLPLTEKTHKCCLTVGKKSLLQGQVQILTSCGITDILVVTGYLRHQVMQHGGSSLEYLFNPFFEISNSIVSLWLSRFYFTENVIIVNCDVIFDKPIIESFIEKKSPISIGVCRCWSLQRGYKVQTNAAGNILRMGTELSEVGGEYAGITCISKEILPDLLQRMECFLDNKKFGVWYEDVVSDMIESHFIAQAVYVSEDSWYELDTALEYKFANERYKDW